MRFIDFSSWQGVLLTLIGLAFFTLISVGIRLVMMFSIQQRRERVNRQINERLRTLIAAYKTLGGSFTGELSVDPTHLRGARERAREAAHASAGVDDTPANTISERARRIRDAVEAALSDIILLGTEEHVRLAERAASELIAGRRVHTHELVVSLRDFIRDALDLEPVPADVEIPRQGPARQMSSGSRGKGDQGSRGGGGGQSGGQGGGGGALGMGLGGGEHTTQDHS